MSVQQLLVIFGGIKLGAGGLIRAYAGSVALAVKEIGIIEIKEQAGIQIHMTYAQYQEYGNFLKEHNLIGIKRQTLQIKLTL